MAALGKADPKTRRLAVRKLGNVGLADPAVLPALLGALGDPDAGVRREAVLAVLKCGPDARATAPRLAELRQRDPDPAVRDCAGRVLEKLRDGG